MLHGSCPQIVLTAYRMARDLWGISGVPDFAGNVAAKRLPDPGRAGSVAAEANQSSLSAYARE